MVLPPALVTGGAISRAVVSSYSGRGTLAMAPLVAIGAQLIVVSILTLFLLHVLVIDRNLSISPRHSFNSDEHSR